MNAREKQERNDRILANAAKLEQIRDIVHKVIGSDVEASLVLRIGNHIRLEGDGDVDLLENDLKNAKGFVKQLFGEKDVENTYTVVETYEFCTAKSLDELEED